MRIGLTSVVFALVMSGLVLACAGGAKKDAQSPAKKDTQPPVTSEASRDSATAAAPDPSPDAEVTEPATNARPATPEAAVDQAIAIFLETAKLLTDAGEDCAAMAANLNSWLDANDARRKAVMDALAALPEQDRSEKFRAKMSEHVEELKGLQAALTACAKDETFAKAWQRLDM